MTNIQERMQTYIVNSVINSSTPLQFNYASGSVMIIPNTISITSNYTVNITGLPSSLATIPDNTRSFVISTINAASTGSNFIATGVSINSTTLPMFFSGGNASIPSAPATAITVQQIALVSTGTPTPQTASNVEFALSSVSQFYP